MRKIFSLARGGFILLFFMSCSLFDLELNTLTFVNETDLDLYYIFVSPGDSDTWGADIMGRDNTLPPGLERTYNIHYPDSSNDFDVLVMDSEGNHYAFWPG